MTEEERRERRRAYTREAMRKWRAANPERNRESRRKRDQADPSKKRSEKRKALYGIPDGRTEGTCEICGQHAKPICLDHDHATGKFRGWLCRNCNSLLGYARDSSDRLFRAMAYLQSKA